MGNARCCQAIGNSYHAVRIIYDFHIIPRMTTLEWDELIMGFLINLSHLSFVPLCTHQPPFFCVLKCFSIDGAFHSTVNKGFKCTHSLFISHLVRFEVEYI